MDNIKNDINNMSHDIEEFKNLLKIVKLKVISLQKGYTKKIASLERKINKNKQKKKKPSGFAKPSKISSQLCSFLNKPPGTKIARTDVTRHLINYIKEHKLQDNDNKKTICPDQKLKNLLDINNNITFFSIQGLMNKHFLKYNENVIDCETN
jgi:chromatin remodeling complex protein RSC6